MTKAADKKTAKRKAASKKKASAKKTAKARKPRIAKPRAQAESKELPADKATRVAYREGALRGERESWVRAIRDPKHRALADAIPKICDLWGVRVDVLAAEDLSKTPASANQNSLRMLALGCVIQLGVDLGMSWNELHNNPASGRSEVLDLPVHAFTIRSAHDRWTALQSLDGAVPEMVRARFSDIRIRAMSALAAKVGGAR